MLKGNALDVLPAQFYGTLIGVMITAIITVLLLKGQTDNAEKLKKNDVLMERYSHLLEHFRK